MKILLLGPPGSGKSLHSNYLAKKYNLKKISTRKILSEIAKSNTELGKKINSFIDSGKLVPNELMDKIMEKEIKKVKDNFVVDGYPRDPYQAKFLDKIAKMDHIFLLDIPEEEIIRRLSNRRQCINGHIFSLIIKGIIPKKPEICDFCNIPLFQRDDDKPDAIKARLNIYIKETIPFIKHYKNRIIKINGNREVEDVSKSIIDYIGEK